MVGILIFFFFLWFGGGKTVKKFGEGLTDTGKKMEVLEETVRKEKDEMKNELKKKILKEEKGSKKEISK
jgi:hypothetical protein